MRKKMFLSLLGLMVLTANAQQENEGKKEITTIDDIVGEQQQVAVLNATESHFKDVWGRNGYFNIAWVTSETMSPRETILTGIDANQQVGDLSASGLSLMLGTNIGLHKPIANMVRINMDIQGDLTWTHYKKTNGGQYNTDYFDVKYLYMPWNLEDHKLQLGLAFGPSLTVAPFTTLDVEGLHFLKFNIYYHFGYQASVFLMKDSKADMADQASATKRSGDFEDADKGGYGHGITSSFGFGLSWRFIGLGYEYSSSRNNVKPFDSLFRSDQSKFKVGTNRLFVQFRF